MHFKNGARAEEKSHLLNRSSSCIGWIRRLGCFPSPSKNRPREQASGRSLSQHGGPHKSSNVIFHGETDEKAAPSTHLWPGWPAWKGSSATLENLPRPCPKERNNICSTLGEGEPYYYNNITTNMIPGSSIYPDNNSMVSTCIFLLLPHLRCWLRVYSQRSITKPGLLQEMLVWKRWRHQQLQLDHCSIGFSTSEGKTPDYGIRYP